MTSITIHLPQEVADRIRRDAQATGRDVDDVASEVVIQHFGHTVEAVKDDERRESQVLHQVHERLADGRMGRPADEVFADLEVRAVKDAQERGLDDKTIATALLS